MSAYYELTDEQLLALPTHRLYTIYKLYRSSALHSGYYESYNEDLPESDTDQKVAIIKAELDKRGHIPRKHNPNGVNVEKPFSNYKGWFVEPERQREPKHGSIENYEDAIGKRVFKNSKKPFKSKNLYNTVNAVTKNPHTDLPAFSFEEDDSIVDANICTIRKIKS